MSGTNVPALWKLTSSGRKQTINNKDKKLHSMLETCMLGRKHKTAKGDMNHKNITLIDRWSGEAAGNHVP